MTVFSTRSYRSMIRSFRLFLTLMFCFALNTMAVAESEIRYAEIVLTEEGYVVNADIDLKLNARLIEVVNRGVPLHFIAEFQIEQPRWYWLNRDVVERTIEYRLVYHTITRSYRLSIGTLHRSFDTIDEAIRTMSRIRNWKVASPDALQAGVSYNAALRFRHDTAMLPKPFQVTAIGSRDWNLATDWMTWTFLAGAIR